MDYRRRRRRGRGRRAPCTNGQQTEPRNDRLRNELTTSADLATEGVTARHAEEFTAVGIAQWFKDPLAFELASRMTPGRIPALRAIEGAMIAALREVARTGGKYIGDAPPHIWLTARLIASARNPLAGDPAVTLVAAELRRLTGDPRPMFAIASDLLHTIGSLGETDPSEESAI